MFFSVLNILTHLTTTCWFNPSREYQQLWHKETIVDEVIDAHYLPMHIHPRFLPAVGAVTGVCIRGQKAAELGTFYQFNFLCTKRICDLLWPRSQNEVGGSLMFQRPDNQNRVVMFHIASTNWSSK